MNPVSIDAVIENGVLRPLEPLDFAEHQRVHFAVSVGDGPWFDNAFVAACSARSAIAPSLEETRSMLSAIRRER